MNEIQVKVDSLRNQVIELGHQGENGATVVKFDFSPWLETFGHGVITLSHRRANDLDPTPVFVTQNEGIASWIINDTDTHFAGEGRAEILYSVNEVIVKTDTYTTRVKKSISSISEASEPWQRYWKETSQKVGAFLIEAEEQFEEEQEGREEKFNTAQEERSTAFNQAQSARATSFSTEQVQRTQAFNEAQATRTTVFNTNITNWGNQVDQAVAGANTAKNNAQAVADEVQARADRGDFNGQPGDKGVPGQPGEPGHSPVITATKEDGTTTIYSDGSAIGEIQDGEPADMSRVEALEQGKADKSTVEQLETENSELRKQVQRNEQRLEIAEAILSGEDTGWKLETEDSYEHAVPAYLVEPEGKDYGFADVVGIGGNTVVWNQLVYFNNSNFVNSGISITKNEQAVTAKGTATEHIYQRLACGDIEFIAGHKYLAIPSVGSTSTYRFYFSSAQSPTGATLNFSNTPIFTATNSIVVNGIYLYVAKDLTIDLSENIYVIDLTLTTGFSDITDLNDPRIKWLKHYAELHPELNAGELVSASVESVESVAVNGEVMATMPIPEQLRDLKRAGSVFDSLDLLADEKVQRVGVVDLGSLNWQMLSVSEGTLFRNVFNEAKQQRYDIAPNYMCSKYTSVKQADRKSGTITCSSNTSKYVDIIDDNYTNATDFKQAIQGVLLYYELAEPITTDISGLIPKSFMQAEPNGAIRFNSDTQLPVHNAIRFPVDNRKALGV